MWKLNTAHLLRTLLTVLLLTACQPIRPDQDMNTQSTLLTLQPPTAGETRTASELFAAVSPALALVETPSWTGSAILVQDNYLLTNAHAVWPYSEVRVAFPDGSQHPAAPVAGWDLIADLALIGPIDTEIEPLPLVEAGDLPVGSDVYLIGYPAEEEAFPQPTITTGILSRLRSWETIDYTFFQVDAAAIQGQSGGVMVTDTGDVVGISTFIFSGFGLAASIADALPRLNTVLGHDLGVTIEQRGFPQGEGRREFERTLHDHRDLHRYLLREAVDTEIEISIKGVGLPHINARPLGGEFWRQSKLRGLEQRLYAVEFTVESSAPYIVEVQQPSQNVNSYLLTSSHPLLAYPDPDDRRVLAAGDSYLGVLDVPGDTDLFELDLKAGEQVQIDVDSIGIDPWTTLLYESVSFQEIVSDDDSGGGLFGENSRIVYRAPRDGTYLLFVADYTGKGAFSYFVNVTVPNEAAQLTEPEVSRKVLRTSFGWMSRYESDRFGFSMLAPIGWDAGPAAACEQFVLCYFSGAATTFLVTEEALHELLPQQRSRKGYIESFDAGFLLQPGVEKLSAQAITTVQGLEADRIDYSLGNGQALSTVFVYRDEIREAVFVLVVYTHPGYHYGHEPLIELFIDSFRVWNSEQRDDSAVFHLDSAARLAADKAYEEALAAYARSIELDPELMKAYRNRASLLNALGRHEEALLDVDEILELDPDDADLIAFRAAILWAMDRLDDALASIDRAIELEEAPPAEYFRNRALMLSQNGAFERALADVAKAMELSEWLPWQPELQDTRGYVYLKMGELEKALADFDIVLDNDHPIPHSLLGAAIIHGRMGNNEKALELIAKAMEQLEKNELARESPDPQLADLLEMAAAFAGQEADSR